MTGVAGDPQSHDARKRHVRLSTVSCVAALCPTRPRVLALTLLLRGALSRVVLGSLSIIRDHGAMTRVCTATVDSLLVGAFVSLLTAAPAAAQNYDAALQVRFGTFLQGGGVQGRASQAATA